MVQSAAVGSCPHKLLLLDHGMYAQGPDVTDKCLFPFRSIGQRFLDKPALWVICKEDYAVRDT